MPNDVGAFLDDDNIRVLVSHDKRALNDLCSHADRIVADTLARAQLVCGGGGGVFFGLLSDFFGAFCAHPQIPPPQRGSNE